MSRDWENALVTTGVGQLDRASITCILLIIILAEEWQFLYTGGFVIKGFLYRDFAKPTPKRKRYQNFPDSPRI